MERSGLTIAITYDLKSDYASTKGCSYEDLAEFDEEETISAVESSLRSLGHRSVRVGNLRHLVRALAAKEYRDWHLVFNMAEGWHGSARESQVPGLLEAYQVPCVFSNARVYSIAHDKALTKILLRHRRVPVAPFTLILGQEDFLPLDNQGWTAALSSPEQNCNAFSGDTPALFVKPNMECTSKGIYDFNMASTAAEMNDAVQKLRKLFPRQDLLVETFLDGRELTVSIVGTGEDAQVLGVTEVVWRGGGAHFWTCHGKMCTEEGEQWTEMAVTNGDPEVAESERIALEAWKALGCRDGGRVDVRSQGWGTDATPYVMEVNPLAGLRPGWSEYPMAAERAGYDYTALIGKLIESAMQREGLDGSRL